MNHMENMIDNNFIINLDDESESSSDEELGSEDGSGSEEESDLEDEDIEEVFGIFDSVFNIYKRDPDIKYLTYNEKLLIVNILNNIPYMDHNQYEEVKEKFLQFRTNIDPSINYYLIKKILNKDKIDSVKVTSTLENYIKQMYDENPLEQVDNQTKELDLDSNEYKKQFYSIIKTEQLKSECQGLLALPDEIIERILLFAIPTADLDINNYFEIRTTCKTFYKIIYTKYYTNRIVTDLGLKESLTTKFDNLNQVSLPIYKNITFGFIYNIFKNYLIRMLGSHIIKAIGGFENFFKIPFIEGFHDKCLDNLCGGYCGFKYHFIHQVVKSPISRGIDSKGRLFFLFIYKTESNDIFYEFIYNNEFPKVLNMTFSGSHLKTFIGNKSMNYTDYNSASYRTLKYKSYEYIERLIKGEAGEVNFESDLSYAKEDLTKPVKLFYEEKELLKFIKKNYIESISSIHD